MNYSLRALAALGMLTPLACAPQNSSVMSHERHGTTEFQSMLRVGNNPNNPAPMREGPRLNLDSKTSLLMIDPASGAWSWVVFDKDRQPLLGLGESVIDWSKKYIEQNASNLGLTASELSSFDNTLYEPFPNQTYVTFNRVYQGIPVKSAFVQLIFAKDQDGLRLSEVLNNSFGPIKLDTTIPANLSAEEAIEKTGLEGVKTTDQKTVIQPRLGADGLYEFHYATLFNIEDSATGERFAVTMSNHDQSILEALSNHRHVKQELSVETYKVSYVLKDQYPVPFSNVKVGAANADANGVIDATTATSTIALTSNFGSVINRTVSANAPYTFPVTFAASGKTLVTLANADPAALNGYMALAEVSRWVAQFLTPAQLPLLNTGIVANVNVVGNPNTDGSRFCNAYYNGTTLTFFAQGTEGGTSCGNTALIKDVMYHEWGHAMDDQVGIASAPTGGKITDDTFSEGIGDINAILAGGIPGLGLGFFLNDAKTFLRNADNALTYPPAPGAASEIHTAGQIISGSIWDLRQNLVTILGKDAGSKAAGNLFYKHLLVTDRYIDSYKSILRLDDNDNNPATPSPNYCLINKAFARHGLTGGVVEPATCTVPDPGLKVRVDTDLGNGNLVLLASSFGASSIAICEGASIACTDKSTGYIAFKPIVAANSLVQGPKLFYDGVDEKNPTNTVTLKVEAGKTYSIVSRNPSGVVIGSKNLSFSARDTKGDLSSKYR